MEFWCYHGTDEVSLQSILSQKKFKFKRRQDHWLGDGAYFFIDDFEKAKWWSKVISSKSGRPPVVLYFNLRVSDTELLNLNIESDLNMLDRFSEELFRTLNENKFSLKFKDEHELNCFVLNSFFERNPNYKVVRRTFHSTRNRVGKSGFSMLSDQICIMNQNVIPFTEIKVKSIM